MFTNDIQFESLQTQDSACENRLEIQNYFSELLT